MWRREGSWQRPDVPVTLSCRTTLVLRPGRSGELGGRGIGPQNLSASLVQAGDEVSRKSVAQHSKSSG